MHQFSISWTVTLTSNVNGNLKSPVEYSGVKRIGLTVGPEVLENYPKKY